MWKSNGFNWDGGIKLTSIVDVVLSMGQDFKRADEVHGIHPRVCDNQYTLPNGYSRIGKDSRSFMHMCFSLDKHLDIENTPNPRVSIHCGIQLTQCE